MVTEQQQQQGKQGLLHLSLLPFLVVSIHIYFIN